MPDVERFAVDCELFGAQGITVHPRPDERHIRKEDVYQLKSMVKTELNVEGNPTEEFMALVTDIRPTQVTLVPDDPNQLTSNHGWDTKRHLDFLKGVVNELHSHRIRVSIFVDPDPVMVEYARMKGAGDEAEDIVQEVFADLAKVFKAGRYVRDKGRFKNYLAKMLRNELVSRFRRGQARPDRDGVNITTTSVVANKELQVEPSFGEIEADDEAWELARHRAAVEHVLAKTALSEQSRRIYRELMVTGDNCAEVARRLGLMRKYRP